MVAPGLSVFFVLAHQNAVGQEWCFKALPAYFVLAHQNAVGQEWCFKALPAFFVLAHQNAVGQEWCLKVLAHHEDLKGVATAKGQERSPRIVLQSKQKA